MAVKILYVLPPSPHFAGMERVVHDVATGLASRYRDRFDITVLYCHRYEELAGELLYRVVWEDVRRLRGFPFRIARWLCREPFDVVVVAQFEPAALLWLCHRLCGGGARFVMHFHGNPKVEENGSRRARFAFLFFNALLPRMSRVFAASPSLARYVEGRVGRRNLVEYLPNPVRQFSDVRRSEGHDNAVRFVSIGRLAWQKGHDILIEAFARIVANGLDARLTIVGDGPELPALRSQIDRLALNGAVRLAGNIANPAAELAAADCFVSASRWEGFGVAIVEALSAGLHVIASDCEFGPSDLIDQPEKGQVVPTGNIDALTTAMSDVVRSGRSHAHEQARRNAAALFSLDNVVAQHAATLASVAGSGSR